MRAESASQAATTQSNTTSFNRNKFGSLKVIITTLTIRTISVGQVEEEHVEVTFEMHTQAEMINGVDLASEGRKKVATLIHLSTKEKETNESPHLDSQVSTMDLIVNDMIDGSKTNKAPRMDRRSRKECALSHPHLQGLSLLWSDECNLRLNRLILRE